MSAVRVLLEHHARLHRGALVPLAVGLALFEWMMTFVAGQPSVSRFLGEALRAAPPQFLALLNQDLLVGVSVRGIVGVGYAHPFALIMMAVWAVRVPCAALAGEIGRGTMDIVASRPVARSSQVAAAAAALLAGLTVLAGAAWLGTLVGLTLRPLEGVSALRYLPVAAALWLTFACFGMVAILVSALSREAGTAIAWISGLLAGSYVLDYVARVWPRIASLRPASLFMYYEPQQVVSVGLARHDLGVQAAVGAAALLAAFVVFARRDL
ncbi:MAG TPA: ABC transporter permease subunit [Gemmatimonadales bacterium]|nr:ABC transporter permease subunit [Gemmatimonadales bacterium]